MTHIDWAKAMGLPHDVRFTQWLWPPVRYNPARFPRTALWLFSTEFAQPSLYPLVFHASSVLSKTERMRHFSWRVGLPDTLLTNEMTNAEIDRRINAVLKGRR